MILLVVRADMGLFQILGLGFAVVLMFYTAYKNQKGDFEYLKLGKKLGIVPSADDDGIIESSLPKLEGRVNGYHVGIKAIRHRNKIETVVRVYGRTKTELEIWLTRNRRVKWILREEITPPVLTGFDSFDNQFRLHSNDPLLSSRIFSHSICEDFASNAVTFDHAKMSYHSGYVEFRESGIPDTEDKIDRMVEIVKFLIHLTKRIDDIQKQIKT